MSFFEHLGEVRSRLTVIVVALVVLAMISYPYSLRILDILFSRLPDMTFTTHNFMEPFMLRFKVSVLTAFAACLPLIIYEILAFLTPALAGKERRILFPIVTAMALLFLGGAAFSYYIVMPVGVQWLLAQAGESLLPLNNASDSLNFVILFLVAFGVAFEMPVVLYSLLRLRIVKYRTLRKNWRVAYVVMFIVAAVATPDWSIPPMLMLGSAMLVLYEGTMLLVRFSFGRERDESDS